MMRNYGDLVEEEGKPSSEYQREQDFANGKDGGQAFSRSVHDPCSVVCDMHAAYWTGMTSTYT